jgi:hypothetical protein
MKDLRLDDEIEAELQGIRAKFSAVVERGDEEEVEQFLGWLSEEKGYVVESQVLRKQWEDRQFFDAKREDNYNAGYTEGGTKI